MPRIKRSTKPVYHKKTIVYESESSEECSSTSSDRVDYILESEEDSSSSSFYEPDPRRALGVKPRDVTRGTRGKPRKSKVGQGRKSTRTPEESYESSDELTGDDSTYSATSSAELSPPRKKRVSAYDKIPQDIKDDVCDFYATHKNYSTTARHFQLTTYMVRKIISGGTAPR